jgi:hypothetical protein
MGIRKKARKLAMAAAVPGMVMGAFAAAGAAPAMAATAHHQKPPSFETFNGFGTGEYGGHFGVVPLYAHGVINDHGFIDLLGPNPGDIIHLSHGDLDVSHTDFGHEHLYPASCTIVLSANSDYAIIGGTGDYTGASGGGHSYVKLTAITGREHNGNCGTSRVLPSSVRVYFDAGGPWACSGGIALR